MRVGVRKRRQFEETTEFTRATGAETAANCLPLG